MGNNKWFEIERSCVRCTNRLAIETVEFDENGVLLFTFFCYNCKKDVEWHIASSTLKHVARKNNAKQREKVLSASNLIKPIIFPPPGKMKKLDQAFLKALNISTSSKSGRGQS